MTEYISYDSNGNEIYQVFESTTHNLLNVDNNAIQIDAHNDDGHLVIRASSVQDENFISCIDTGVDPEEQKMSLSTEGTLVVRQLEAGNTVLQNTFATVLNTQSLGVSGQSHLVGTSAFGDLETPTMQINSQGMQIDKELVINDALLSTGGIALLDDAVLGFKPYDQNGQPLEAGNQYTFGRHAQIGDLSHDNDGLCLRLINTVDGIKEAHTVLIAPNPTDPNIVIHSRKNTDFMQFISCPDDDTLIREEDTVFSVTNRGFIHSDQMQQVFERLERLEFFLQAAEAVPENTPDLQQHVTENNITG